MDIHWGHYHKLRPAQIDDIRARVSVAYVPWGALEWHSYHNPIGLDGLIAEDLCTSLAKSVGGLVLPPVYVGTDTIKVGLGFPHSVEHSQQTVSDLCFQFCEQLAAEGFEVVIVVTGHSGAGHREALGTAVDKARVALPGTVFKLIPAFDPIEDIWRVNHAAEGETSLQIAVDSTLVDLSKLPQGRTATLEDDGVWGNDPASANQTKGEEIRALFVERCSGIVRDILKNIALG
ncbi:MAG: creatininase family protein [Rhodothermales bacterium]|nr:creatininase family protein [Rhodothermales bacterium]